MRCQLLFHLTLVSIAAFSSSHLLIPAAIRATNNLPRRIENILPSVYIENVNVTTTHLVRRGCFPSKEDEDDIGPTTCDGSVPSIEEMQAQIRRWNKVATRVPAFYTRLGAGGAIATSKCWVRTHPDQIPPIPKNLIDPRDKQGDLGAVFFDNIVDQRYENAVFQTMSNSRQISYQKLLSQVMAMESHGTVWIFTKADVDFSTLNDVNTWWVAVLVSRRSDLELTRH
jgi:hypothetical protein